jgi:rSAM/selenodomain-associated transferase 2
VISVIIPVLNEEASLGATLESVHRATGDCELIIVDGGSTDTTPAIAARYGRLLRSQRGRAVQMNHGAAHATGDILLFLHADVLFPVDGLRAIEQSLGDPRIVGGNLSIVYEGTSHVSRVFTLINQWRRPFGIFYGDSGIFVRRIVFEAMNGYRLLPLMEDYDFARRLIRRGRTVCLNQPLWVSARRWDEYGLLRTLLAWVVLHFCYYLRVPTTLWSRLYPAVRRAHGPSDIGPAQIPLIRLGFIPSREIHPGPDSSGKTDHSSDLQEG